MGKKLLRFVNAWTPVIIWAAFIFKLSSGAVPSVSSVYIQDFIFKKSAHMFVFGVIAVLFYRALKIYKVSTKKAVYWGIILATLYGGSDEYHQSFSQVREARVRDVGFDGIGATVAMLFVYYILPMLPKQALSILTKFDLI